MNVFSLLVKLLQLFSLRRVLMTELQIQSSHANAVIYEYMVQLTNNAAVSLVISPRVPTTSTPFPHYQPSEVGRVMRLR